MEKLRFMALADAQGQIETIEIGGLLVLETAGDFKDELVNVLDRLSSNVKIVICDLEEIDLSAIQLIVAFIRQMEKKMTTYQFDWIIDKDQKSLIVNAGVGIELFLNN